MNANFLVTVLIFTKVLANIDNEFLVDYFNYKMASKVIGFTCNSISGNSVT